MAKSQQALGPDRLERFERSIVFRVARGSFLAIAAFAALALVGGITTLSLGLWHSVIPEPKEPPKVEPPSPLTLDAVEKWQKQQVSQRAADTQAVRDTATLGARPVTATTTARQQSPEQAAKEEVNHLLAQLRELFPPPTYTWEDVYEERCKVPSSYGCLQTDRHLIHEGVLRLIQSAMRDVPGGDVLPVLRTMVTVLGQAKAEQRGELLSAVIGAYENTWSTYQEQRRAREASVEEAQRAYKQQTAEQEESRAHLRAAGLYGAAGGIALLVLVSLFLLQFAMERHLRLMSNVVADGLAGGLNQFRSRSGYATSGVQVSGDPDTEIRAIITHNS